MSEINLPVHSGNARVRVWHWKDFPEVQATSDSWWSRCWRCSVIRRRRKVDTRRHPKPSWLEPTKIMHHQSLFVIKIIFSSLSISFSSLNFKTEVVTIEIRNSPLEQKWESLHWTDTFPKRETFRPQRVDRRWRTASEFCAEHSRRSPMTWQESNLRKLQPKNCQIFESVNHFHCLVLFYVKVQ